MSDPAPQFRWLRLRKDGTVTVTLEPDEVPFYSGPMVSTDALLRIQVVNVADLEAEADGSKPVLPWFRRRDRLRAIEDLRRLDAPRNILEHVARTPVVSFTPAMWTTITMVRGRWETDEPFRADLVCSGGGAVFDAALPISFGKEDREDYLRSLDRTDPRIRERVAAVMGRHEDGLPKGQTVGVPD